MFLKYLSGVWTALAPAMGNHLWQSTLFAITAGLLTLALRKNRARARYWLWLAASVKFLVPFSLLVIMGSRLPWSRGSAGAKAGLSFVMEEVGQPFMQPMTQIVSSGPPSTVRANFIHLVSAVLAVWLCGFLGVIFVWLLRWQRVSAAIREATPLREGREVEALRRLEHIEGIRKQTEILLSRASLEPGIFGIVQPILIWPEMISERLEDAHLEAILAHELWHVRRRDNLAAAIHMMVEAIFWFHPLVWWMGARLMDERERACDEEVLESGRERQVYAESILKICEFCVGSPLACVSGVTGADLKRRIARIMSKRVTRRLDLSRKLLLSAAGLLAVVVPIVFGLLHAPQARAGSPAQNTATNAPTFSGVLIKSNKSTDNAMHKMLGGPDGYSMENVTLRMLIGDVYGVQDDRISGAPEWLNSEKYDIQAKIDKSAADELQKLSPAQRELERGRMLQALLAEHFKLTLHRETREISVYVLGIDDNGPKLQLAKPGDTYPNGIKGLDGLPAGPHRVGGQRGQLTVQALSMATVASVLSREFGGRTILDRTGLKGEYDFTVRWTPDANQAVILTAIEEQLGLKLETQKVPMEVLVIDHAEQPSEPQAQNTEIIPPVFAVASVKLNKAGTASLKTGGVIRQRRM
jgi:bla regulator protein blaR1